MKKSKLLIPALSIASVGAVVAPMVTSCACDKGVIEFNSVAEKTAKEYTTKFKSLDEKKFKDQKALAAAYNDAINADASVFADDFLERYAAYLAQASMASSLPTSETIKISNAAVTGTLLKEGILTSLICADIDVKQERDGYIWHLQYKLTNLPYTMYFVDPTGTYTTPTLKSTMPFIVKDESAILAFIASGFAIDVTLSVTDKETSEVYTDVHICVDEAAELAYLVEEGETYVEAILQPLMLDIPSNYFEKAVQGENK